MAKTYNPSWTQFRNALKKYEILARQTYYDRGDDMQINDAVENARLEREPDTPTRLWCDRETAEGHLDTRGLAGNYLTKQDKWNYVLISMHVETGKVTFNVRLPWQGWFECTFANKKDEEDFIKKLANVKHVDPEIVAAKENACLKYYGLA
jgi:hypothetical protein